MVNDHCNAKEDDEDVVPTNTTTIEVGSSNTKEYAPMDTSIISYVPLADRGAPHSLFEQLLSTCMYIMDVNQRLHHEFSVARFQHLDNQIRGI